MSGPGIPWTTVEDAIQAWVAFSTGLAGTSVIWALQNDARPATPFITLRVMSVHRTGLDWRDFVTNPLTFPAIAVTGVGVSPANTLTAPNHGLFQGDGPVQVASSGTIPAGLAALTDYWAIPVDANTLQLAASFFDAWTPVPVAITSAGSGTITLNATANTLRAGKELTARSRGMRRVTLSVQAFGGSADGSASPTALLDAVVANLPGQAQALRTAGVGVMDCGPVGSTEGVIDATVMEPRATLTLVISLKSEVQDPTTIIERVNVTPTIDGTTEPVQTFTLP